MVMKAIWAGLIAIVLIILFNVATHRVVAAVNDAIMLVALVCIIFGVKKLCGKKQR